MDVRNKIAWCYEHKQGYEHCADVERYDERPVQFYRYYVNVVGLRVEFCKSGELL